jgi:butyrate kinase
MKILVINPGSTSTKIALFDDETLIFEHKLDHAKDEQFQRRFTKAGNIFNQYPYRLEAILALLQEKGVGQLDGVVGRGGMLPPLPSGTYQINQKMLDDLNQRPLANHASNLGAPIALEIAKKFDIDTQAFIVDPVTTDEIEPKYKIVGFPGIKRYSGWHALNQKAMCRKYAASIGKKYEDLNLIVAHLGGGFSFGAHKKGKTINVTNAMSGEGPLTPERAGYIPAQNLIDLCFSGQMTQEEIHHKLLGGGGLFALLGTKDMFEVETNYENYTGDQKDAIDCMIANISNFIAYNIPIFEGKPVDQIILTGGLVRWGMLVDRVKKNLSALNIGITTYPGEVELEALRDGALRVLNHKETAKEY